MMQILLVGCGRMGSAILKGCLDAGTIRSCDIIDPYMDAADFAGAVRLIPSEGIKPEYDAVIIAVKPQTMDEALAQIASVKAGFFLSIAAGKTIASFENALGAGQAIIRSMPNTPAAIGKGITVCVGNKNISEAHRRAATDLLRSVGLVEWVEDENLLDAVTALSGSGPAYVFLLIEAMTKAGVSIGLDEGLAARLARQTVIGSAALAEKSDEKPEKLRDNVTSPGGTTAAALSVLMADDGIQPLFNKALHTAKERSHELSGTKTGR